MKVIIVILLFLITLYSYGQDKDIEKIRHKRDSALSSVPSLSRKIDSLSATVDPRSSIYSSLDSLRKQFDSLETPGFVDKSREGLSKIQSVESKARQKLQTIEGKVNTKINLPDVGSKIDLPDLRAPDINIPNLDSKIVPSNSITKESMEKIEKLKEVDALKSINRNASQVTEVTQEINAYSRDIKSIASGDSDAINQVSEKIETKFMGLEKVQTFQEDLNPIQDYSEMAKKWSSDPEVSKEIALNQSKEFAQNHFAGHEKELKEVMQKLASAKEKHQKFGYAVDLFAKKNKNPIRSLPTIERLIPGLTIQLQTRGNVWLDISPSIGYRWFGRFNTGLGWIERISYDFKKWNYNGSERAYGPRAYAEFMVKYDFFVRLESEYIKSPVLSPYILNQPDAPQVAWVWSHFAGMKKSFKLSNAIQGNLQTFYNLYNPLQRSPYNGRLMVRMGLEFTLKGKSAKND